MMKMVLKMKTRISCEQIFDLSRTYAVYIDVLSDGTAIYVGCGQQARILDPHRGKKHRDLVAQNGGFVRHVVFQTNIKQEALGKEDERIKSLNTLCHLNPIYGCNVRKLRPQRHLWRQTTFRDPQWATEDTASREMMTPTSGALIFSVCHVEAFIASDVVPVDLTKRVFNIAPHDNRPSGESHWMRNEVKLKAANDKRRATLMKRRGIK